MNKKILISALAVAVLFDRLMVASVFGEHFFILTGIFWGVFLIIFYYLYWQKLKHNKFLWYIAGCVFALCGWFTYNTAFENQAYRAVTFLVIPAVVMAHVQTAAGGFGAYDTGGIAAAWFKGWFIKPFTGLGALLESLGAFISPQNKPIVKRLVIGTLSVLILLLVLVPLLSGADMVFGFYIRQTLGSLKISSFIGHSAVIVIFFGLFYSVLWNVGFGHNEKINLPEGLTIDRLICVMVLGSVILLYVLFCSVQFTYLFAGAGLPDGMTYSAYAREGFAQTVAVCAINLLLFGVFFQFGAKYTMITGFLTGLLVLTGIMLVSGAVRLSLYVDAYGLTWLRLLSAWFIIYLAAVMLLTGVRMVRKKLPLIAVCAMLLLGWYVVLGYANPDRVIERYNEETAPIWCVKGYVFLKNSAMFRLPCKMR